MTASEDLDLEIQVLADGTRVTLRAIRPTDKEALRRAFDQLLPQSRYQRFLTVPSRLTDEMLSYLTEVDGIDHVALIGLTDSHDLKEDIGLGIARFVRLPEDPEVAEAAVTVADDRQGKGLGRLLLTALSKAARKRGIRTFRGEVLASNTAMRRLLENAGARIVEGDDETLLFDAPIGEPEPEPESDHPLWKIFRALAEWLAQLRRGGAGKDGAAGAAGAVVSEGEGPAPGEGSKDAGEA